MKRIAFLLVLVLAPVIQAASFQPALVKDPFNTAQFYGFIPADNEGNYWWRVGFSVPGGNYNTHSKYICIDQVFLGKPRKGKVIVGYGGTEWTERHISGQGGSWGNLQYAGNNIRLTTTQNDYADVNIPAGYNRIDVLSYDQSGGTGALLAFSWNDNSTTGLDVTSYDSGLASGVAEIVVATNANPDGVKKLRIRNNDSSGGARIMGVRCWDTDSTNGNPTTARTGDATKWEGHDLIDKYCSGAASPYYNYRDVISGADNTVSQLVPHYSTIDWAMRWQIDSDDLKWSGGQAHWGDAGTASYTYHSGSDYLTNGADIRVEGTAKSGTAKIANNTLITGYSINIGSTGFLDYDGDDTEDANEPDATWEYNLSPTGLAIKISVAWAATGESGVLYCPMFTFASTNSDDRIMYPPDETEYGIDSDVHGYGAQSCEYLIGGDILVRMTALGPINDMWWLASSKKLYAKYNVGAMLGGWILAPGDVWVFGGRWEVRKLSGNTADFNLDGRVDFEDFACFADSWLWQKPPE